MPHHTRIVSAAWRAARGAALLLAALLLAAAPAVYAHGSMEHPPSRTFSCYFLTPGNPQCQVAWNANPQALYDWMEVNIGQANGQHQALIPDGQLCSAGRAKYAAFDAPGTAWPFTELLPDLDGLYTLTWRSSAPHSTEYYRLYLTRDGWDPDQPLRWSDLELVYDSGPWAAVDPVVLRTALPRRAGRHVLYVVWQRDDSPEAFYSCSDVVLGDGTTGNPPPTPLPPAEVTLTLNTQSDWGSGYCVDATVSTTSTQRIDWTVSFHLHDTITTTWNATIVHDGHLATAEGLDWNNAVTATQPQRFGFCANRTSPPAGSPTPSATPTPTGPAATATATRPPATATATRPPATATATRATTATATRTSSPTRTPTQAQSPAPTGGAPLTLSQTVTADWGSGYCTSIVLSTTSATPIDWQVTFTVDGRVRELWSADWRQSGNQVTAEGLSWNNTVSRTASAYFGYCAER